MHTWLAFNYRNDIDSQGRILIRVSTPGSEFNHSSKGVGGVEYGLRVILRNHTDGGDEVDVGWGGSVVAFSTCKDIDLGVGWWQVYDNKDNVQRSKQKRENSKQKRSNSKIKRK